MASELTAARQEVMKASYKVDVVQRQMGDLQKQVAGVQDQMNKMEALLQGLANPQARVVEPRNRQDRAQSGKLEMEVTRRIEDLGQVNLNSTQGVHLIGTPEDPYLNIDVGTMSPFEHGEVFVLDDGGEVDLDFGNYERFLDIKLTRDNNITTGKVYQFVHEKERKGEYLGKTVQVVPHITNAIQDWIERVAMVPVDGKVGPADVCVIKLGGTIGDIESMNFVEALGQFSYRVGAANFCLVPVSLVPVLNVVGEQKTKPTQHSVRGLRGLGLTPNILACRSTKELEENGKEKLSQFCHVPAANIFTLYDVSNIWRIPLLLWDQKAHVAILKDLSLESIAWEPNLEEWVARATLYDTLQDTVRIAMVGKYTGLSDSYLSVLKALLHASVACHRKLVDWVASTDLEDSTATEAPDNYNTAWSLLRGADGILVPGGFGHRGVKGKILAAKYARENNVPYLGICLGMQLAVVEFARHVVNFPDANSTEFDPNTKTPCVIFMPEGSKTHMGGTMRLGSRRTFFKVTDCKSAKLYGNVNYVDERHRHRYEVNPDMVPIFENAGLQFVGKDESGRRMEIIEIPDHRFFVGVQFHPEFKSRPSKPYAPFVRLIAALSGQLDHVLQDNCNGHTIAAQHPLSNGSLKPLVHLNGHAKKHANGVANGTYYANDNGVHGYCFSGQLAEVVRIFKKMSKDGPEPNVVTYNLLMDYLCNNGICAVARKIFDSMVEKDPEANVTTYGILLHGYDTEGALVDMHALLDLMAQNGITLNHHIFNILICAYGKYEMVDKAIHIFNKMRQQRLGPDIVIYATVIDAFCKVGRVDDATFQFNQMIDEGLTPDIIVLSTLVNGLCTCDKWEKVEELAFEVTNRGIHSNAVFFNTIMGNLCKDGRLMEAKIIFDLMVRVGVMPDIVAYSIMIHGYGFVGKRDEAVKLLDGMVLIGLKPNACTYSTLFDGYCKDSRIEDASALFKEMLDKGINPGAITYSIMLDGLFKTGRTAAAKELLKSLKVVYKLQLPEGVGIYLVIHVSQLKIHCSPKAIPSPDLSLVSKDGKLKAEPISVLETRALLLRDRLVTQWLIQWENLPLDDAHGKMPTSSMVLF